MRKTLIFISGVVIGTMLMVSGSALAESVVKKITATFNPDLPVYINGEKFELKNGAINYNDTNYLSIREVAEATGLEVNWNEEKQAVELSEPQEEVYEPEQSESNEPVKDGENMIETINYVDKGTSKKIMIDGSEWEIDFFDFEFVEPSDDQKYYYDDVKTSLKFKAKVVVPEDYRFRIMVDLYGYLNNDPSFVDSINSTNPHFQILITFNGIQRIDGGIIKNGTNYFQFNTIVKTEEKPSKILFRTQNKHDLELMEWAIE